MKHRKIIISGGGTGGHIFPAISIANAIKEIEPQAEILFVGAEGKMEMERVPAAGYPIKGLPVAGLQRKFTLSNFALPFKILKSLNKAKRIIKNFSPDIAIGVGGYASAPLLWSATNKGIPCLIQEQNSYAGLANKILGKRVDRICTAYNGMERFFPKDKIILTGNPIRKNIKPASKEDRELGIKEFDLDPQKKTVFVVGGSLGSATLNKVMKKWILENSTKADYQIIWQSGKFYKSDITAFLKEHNSDKIKNYEFISNMDLAYAAADIIISRAGAGTISELCVAGKATIFVPSPNVTEDHQTHNAQALVSANAAKMVKDLDAQNTLIGEIESLLNNEEEIKKLETNILKLAKPTAAKDIAKEALQLIEKNGK